MATGHATFNNTWLIHFRYILISMSKLISIDRFFIKMSRPSETVGESEKNKLSK